MQKQHDDLVRALTCSQCNRSVCVSSCPYYTPPKPEHYCCICKNGIFEGEEYIKNQDGKYRHYDCFYGLRELLSWLGYEVSVMSEEE